MDVEFRRLFRPFGRHKIPAEIIRPNSSCAGRGVAGQTCQCAPSGPIRGARDSRGRRCECPRRPCLGPPFFLMASRYFAICCPEMVSRRLSGGDGVRPAALQLTVSRASAVFPPVLSGVALSTDGRSGAVASSGADRALGISSKIGPEVSCAHRSSPSESALSTNGV